MDEPCEGLAPQIVAEMKRTIARLKEEGRSIVLVEPNIKHAPDLADIGSRKAASATFDLCQIPAQTQV